MSNWLLFADNRDPKAHTYSGVDDEGVVGSFIT